MSSRRGRGGHRGRRGAHREDISNNFYKIAKGRNKNKPYKSGSQDRASGEGQSNSASPDNKMRSHPQGLSGRDIGLWYASQNRDRKKKELLRPLGSVQLSDERKRQIRRLLDANTPAQLATADKNYGHVESSRFKTKFLKTINGNIAENLAVSHACERDATLDAELLESFNKKQENPTYKKMQEQRNRLPAYKMREEIVSIVEENQIVIVSGETGCGKTTQVSQFILDDYITKGKGSLCNIICTQPRRISAISVAERVASERAEALGESIGYQIRLEKVLPKRNAASILFCTTGVILKVMEDNLALNNISHLILDEIHERNVLSDFLIALLKQIVQKRKDLKVILMSATLNADKFARYFGVDSIIEIPGFTYEVTEYYLEDVLMRINYEFIDDKLQYGRTMKGKLRDFYDFMMPHVRKLESDGYYTKRVCRELAKMSSEDMNFPLVIELIIDICSKEKDEGAILVFLTGYGDINNMNNLMAATGKFPSSKYLIIPLHSQLPTIEQKYIFETPPRGIRKIILSTNIAETSITIDDVVFVIDCGKIKMSNFKIETNQQTLLPEWVSLANADQRRGRAGRVRPGVCYHMFSRARKMQMDKYQKPEILRKRLENDVLTLKMLQLGKAQEFLASLIDAPDAEAVALSVDLLQRLNALDEDENLTPLGFHLARLPVGPQVGKMILLGAMFSCLDPILGVAASLEYKDPFQMPLSVDQHIIDAKRKILANGILSDHITIANAMKRFEEVYNRKQFCWEFFLSFSTMNLLLNMKTQFCQYLSELNFLASADPKAKEHNMNSDNVGLIKAIISAGLYPNVIINRHKMHYGKYPRIKNKFFTVYHKRVVLHPKSILCNTERFDSPLLVYYLKLKSNSDFVHDATMVYPLPLLFFGDNFVEHNDNNVNSISISNNIKFKCSESTSKIIKELRDRLNRFLEHKVAHPKCVDWSNDDEVSTLRAIMELITFEDSGAVDLDAYDDFDDYCD